jgi:methylphosphotriester-DNA--protein-cysteine methyltransferase
MSAILHATGQLNEAGAWEAMRRRDLRVAHEFVCAVVTTGIFCRAGCPARMPRRENVRFYRTAGQASAAGFRACKRCRPTGSDPLGALITRIWQSAQSSQSPYVSRTTSPSGTAQHSSALPGGGGWTGSG